MTGPLERLIANLLPTTWSGRDAACTFAAAIDAGHGGDGLGAFMRAWEAWHATGAVPDDRLALGLLELLKAFVSRPDSVVEGLQDSPAGGAA